MPKATPTTYAATATFHRGALQKPDGRSSIKGADREDLIEWFKDKLAEANVQEANLCVVVKEEDAG